MIIEGDSKSTTDKLLSCSLLNTSVGILIHDVKVASSTFNSCSFSHVKRDGNRVAHSLIRELFVSHSIVWGAHAPVSVLPLLAKDLV